MTAVIRSINGSCRSSNLLHSNSLLPVSFNHASFILNVAVDAGDARTSILEGFALIFAKKWFFWLSIRDFTEFHLAKIKAVSLNK